MTSSGTSTIAETCLNSISYTTSAGIAITTSTHSPGYPFINGTASTIANTISVSQYVVQKCAYCKTDLRRIGATMCKPCTDLVDHKILKYDVIKGEYYKGKTRPMPQPHKTEGYPFGSSITAIKDSVITYTTTANTSGTSTITKPLRSTTDVSI